MIRGLRFNLSLATFLALCACAPEGTDGADRDGPQDSAMVRSNPVSANPSAVPSDADDSSRIPTKAERDARLRDQMKPVRPPAAGEPPK